MKDKFNIDVSVLLKELGLDKLPTEEKEKIASMLHQAIEAKMKLFLFEQLSDEELNKLEKLEEKEMIKFLEDTKGIDFEQLILAMAQEVREEFMQDVSYVKGAIDAQKNKTDEQ